MPRWKTRIKRSCNLSRGTTNASLVLPISNWKRSGPRCVPMDASPNWFNASESRPRPPDVRRPTSESHFTTNRLRLALMGKYAWADRGGRPGRFNQLSRVRRSFYGRDSAAAIQNDPVDGGVEYRRAVHFRGGQVKLHVDENFLLKS